METNDPYHLQRFLTAQAASYERALRELHGGRKLTHWIWYIFPQVAGLGHSPTAQEYAIHSKQEAIAYLAHPVLGHRLRQCCAALLEHAGKPIAHIMGYPDDLKLRSSMTLFAAVSEADNIFARILAAFYAGNRDANTIAFLSADD